MKLPACIAVTVAACLMQGCTSATDAPADPPVEAFEVVVEPARLILAAGTAAFLAAQADDTRGMPIGGVSLKFVAEDESMLRVSEQGEVRALGPVGRTVVRVTSGMRQTEVPVIIDAGALSRIEIVSGDAQSVTAGATAAEPLVVRAQDAFGNAVSGIRRRYGVREPQRSRWQPWRVPQHWRPASR